MFIFFMPKCVFNILVQIHLKEFMVFHEAIIFFKKETDLLLASVLPYISNKIIKRYKMNGNFAVLSWTFSSEFDINKTNIISKYKAYKDNR